MSKHDTMPVQFDRVWLRGILTDYLAEKLELDRRDVHIRIQGYDAGWYAIMEYWCDSKGLLGIYREHGCRLPGSPNELSHELCGKILKSLIRKGVKYAAE